MNADVSSLIHKIYFNSFIIDEEKFGPLYKKLFAWNQAIENNTKNQSRHKSFVISNNNLCDKYAQEYQQLLDHVTDTIFTTSKELSSFKYMIKTIFGIDIVKSKLKYNWVK